RRSRREYGLAEQSWLVRAWKTRLVSTEISCPLDWANRRQISTGFSLLSKSSATARLRRLGGNVLSGIPQTLKVRLQLRGAWSKQLASKSWALEMSVIPRAPTCLSSTGC